MRERRPRQRVPKPALLIDAGLARQSWPSQPGGVRTDWTRQPRVTQLVWSVKRRTQERTREAAHYAPSREETVTGLTSSADQTSRRS